MNAQAAEPDRLRPLLDDGSTRVAASFTDAADEPSPEAAVARGMDAAEMRIDRFASPGTDHVLDQVRRFAGIPTIATIRSPTEGGGWDGDDDQRLALFQAVLPHVDAIDIELSSTPILDAVITAAHDAGRTAIVSHHDFTATPSTAHLRDVLTRAEDHGADVVKIATMVHTDRDLRDLAAFTIAHQDRSLIVIGMGPRGTPSRILFPFLGSRLTFAAAGRPTAPGQLSLDETTAMLRALSPELPRAR